MTTNRHIVVTVWIYLAGAAGSQRLIGPQETLVTTTPGTRQLLPLVHAAHRSSMTCRWKCADACSDPVANASDNEYFGDVVGRAVSRRTVLQAGGASAAPALAA